MYSINQLIPLFASLPGTLVTYVHGRLPAGFPSPADDFSVEAIDLNAVLVPRPVSTFLWRVGGTSMQDAGISDGDVLVVDRSLRPQHGDVVVAQLDSQFTVKYLHRRAGRIKLVPANPTFPEICPKDGQELLIVGVVTSAIKQFRRTSGK